MTVSDNDLLPTAPAPPSTASGIIPITMVETVIRMGRRRSLQAPMAASKMDKPSSRFWMANSVIRMAVLATKPINMMTPVCT